MSSSKADKKLSQGDQIGRIFSHRLMVYFGQVFFKITKIAQIFEPLCSTYKIMNIFLRKIDWATFLSNFSQTHPVTLKLTKSNFKKAPAAGRKSRGFSSFDCRKTWKHFGAGWSKIYPYIEADKYPWSLVQDPILRPWVTTPALKILQRNE
jgi:hypothetical protein